MTNLHPAVLGAGKMPLVHDAGTDNHHAYALGRAAIPGPSPEVPFARPTFGPRATQVIETQIPLAEWADSIIAELRLADPYQLFDNLTTLARDLPGGGELALALLAENGFMPAEGEASLQAADDLLAARYEFEDRHQAAMRKMRAIGHLLELGWPPFCVLTTLSDFGPSADDYALSVAYEAGQAPDIAEARAWREGF